MTFDEIQPGARVTLEHVFGEDELEDFRRLSGDTNPLHHDRDFARRAGFRDRVVYGMLSGAQVSRLIGTLLPGPGAIWLEQRFRFEAPVYVGEPIAFELAVTHRSVATRTIAFTVTATAQGGRRVLAGEGVVTVAEPVSFAEPSPPRAPGALDLDGRVALVTGASRGIGRAIANELARRGAAVLLNARAAGSALDEAVAAIVGAGGRAIALAGDASDPALGGRAADAARASFARAIDVLVLNASAPLAQRPFLESGWEEVRAALDVQLRSAVELVRALAPGMADAGGGRVVAIGSAATASPPPGWSSYVTAKAALAGLVRALAIELGPRGIRVNLVSPSLTETDSVAALPLRARKVLGQQKPLRRLATPEDTAGVVAMLCGPAGDFVSGAEIPVAGGASGA